jgi:ABC-type Fe3+-siderophore transport system permease subunit
MLAGSVVLVFADILVALFVVALPLALLIATVAGPMLR